MHTNKGRVWGNKHPLKCHQINENSVTELAAVLETQHIQLHIHCLFFFSCSCFSLEINLQSNGKTFQVGVAEYRSNLEGCKWLHCEALKARKEEESRRVRGTWRLMTPVHWWFEVTKRREEEGWGSILQEVQQTFYCWMSGQRCGMLKAPTKSDLYLNRGHCQDTLGGEGEFL